MAGLGSPILLDRHVPCDAVFNLRDLGGYPTGDGRHVRWRTLFRADGLHRLTAGRSAPVDQLGLRTVLDLRTIAERDAGCFAGDGVQSVHLPVLRSTWDATHLRCDIEDTTTFLVERYLEMAEIGAMAIAAAIELLASSVRLPAVFHCSAGKDRTGVLAALVLASLGVDDRHIAADYQLSAPAVDRMREWMARNHPDVAERMATEPAAFGGCPPDAVLGFLDGLRDRHGSIEAYLQWIGVSAATVDALGNTLLERGND